MRSLSKKTLSLWQSCWSLDNRYLTIPKTSSVNRSFNARIWSERNSSMPPSRKWSQNDSWRTSKSYTTIFLELEFIDCFNRFIIDYRLKLNYHGRKIQPNWKHTPAIPSIVTVMKAVDTAVSWRSVDCVTSIDEENTLLIFKETDFTSPIWSKENLGRE